MKNWILLAIIAPFLFAATGCPNAFLETANKTSDDALAYDAEQHANISDWSTAITDMNTMTAAGKAKRENKSALASYYGGRCGLNLLNFAQDLQNMGSSKLWPVLMSAEVGATVSSLNDCILAESTLLSIDTNFTHLTADENVLLAFIEFAKMGAALEQSNADANHDGTLDGGFDACSSTDIADGAVQQLGTGMTITLGALNASGSSVGSGVTSSVGALCSTIDTMLGTTGFCNTTTASSFTGNSLKALRALIKSNEIGFNSCGGSLGSSLACACP